MMTTTSITWLKLWNLVAVEAVVEVDKKAVHLRILEQA